MRLFRKIVGVGLLGEILTALGLAFVVVNVATTVFMARLDAVVADATYQGALIFYALGGIGWPLLQAGVILLAANLIADRLRPERDVQRPPA